MHLLHRHNLAVTRHHHDTVMVLWLRVLVEAGEELVEEDGKSLLKRLLTAVSFEFV
jgi:hypothetical protein